jgi:hypothetical protein
LLVIFVHLVPHTISGASLWPVTSSFISVFIN